LIRFEGYGLQPVRKLRKINGAIQAAEKLWRAVGRGFIPGINPIESALASAAEVFFSDLFIQKQAFSRSL
jgi:hypothetical protein